MNEERIQAARPLSLPELERMELTVICEYEHREGFLGEPGVSYLLRTDRGTLLFDVGFGPQNPTFGHNAARLGVGMEEVDAVVISHLHADHMGGLKAQRSRTVRIPRDFGDPRGKPCYLPDRGSAEGMTPVGIERPSLLEAGIATTGPLARSLFFFGLTEEQALVARLKGKGLVVLTGCGHPTIEVILRMVRRLAAEPIHAVGGGLHFPITSGRGDFGGLQVQMIFGTGRPCWRRITEEDLTRTIGTLKEAGPARLLLSAHDTCDHALHRFSNEVGARAEVLRAGQTYSL